MHVLVTKDIVILIIEACPASIHEAILGPEASKEIMITTNIMVPVNIGSTKTVLGYGEGLLDYSIVLHGESGPSLTQIVRVILVGYHSIRVVLVLGTICQCGQGGILLGTIPVLIIGVVVFTEQDSTLFIIVVVKVTPTFFNESLA